MKSKWGLSLILILSSVLFSIFFNPFIASACVTLAFFLCPLKKQCFKLLHWESHPLWKNLGAHLISGVCVYLSHFLLISMCYIIFTTSPSQAAHKLTDTTNSTQEYFLSENMLPDQTLNPAAAEFSSQETLSVHFLDVGQADCILVKNNSHAMLIDCGNREDSAYIISYLKEQHIQTLDYLILTHPHEDHIGGATDIMNTFTVHEVFMSPATTSTYTFENLLNTIEEQNLTISIPSIGDSYSLSQVSFTIIAPIKEYDNLNNSSIGLKLQYENDSFLFCGDIESEAEYDLYNAQTNLSADILKISHHGGDTSTTSEFLGAVQPLYAVFSVGKNNSYGHPSSTVLNSLANHGVLYYRTDVQGTIVVTCTGEDEFDWNIEPLNPRSSSY